VKKYIIFAFMTVVLWLANAHAQSITVRADVPFDFVAGDATFHPGTYKIQPIDVSGAVLRIQSEDNPSETTLITTCNCLSEANTETVGRLVFKKIDSRYYLWQIWTAEYSKGRAVPLNVRGTEPERAATQTRIVNLASTGR
jgi:hypothetical protein